MNRPELAKLHNQVDDVLHDLEKLVYEELDGAIVYSLGSLPRLADAVKELKALKAELLREYREANR